MISLSRIQKQYGKQVLFVDASFQLNPGEKVGLVGPNGAGKTTLFRMITGEETADEGDVSVPRKLTIGYFRQDVEEMSGRSVLDEAIAGSGRLGDLHHELEALQHAMGDPGQADDMDRSWSVSARCRRSTTTSAATRSKPRRAKCSTASASTTRRSMATWAPCPAGGRCAWPWPACCSVARRAADGRADQPPRHRVHHLARAVPQIADGRAAHDVARPRLHEPHRDEASPRSTAARSRCTRATTTSTSASARCARRTARRQFARQQAMLAKEQRFIDRFAAHAAKAAQVQSRVKALDKIEKIELPKKRKVVKFDLRQPPRSGDEVGVLEGLTKAYGSRVVHDDLDMIDPPRRAWCVMGKERRGQDDAAEDDRWGRWSPTRARDARRQPSDGLLRPAGARLLDPT
jgi:ATPase subunit of ABC transporter with duplicated ATPase domains